MTLPELSARLERLSQMDDDRIFKLVLAEAYRTGQLVERDRVAGVVKTLRSLRYWFDTDEEILAAMSHDERADNARQIAKIDAALTALKGGDHA